MALQQATINEATNTNWIINSAAKMAGLFVAGLFFTILLYNRPAGSNTAAQSCIPTQEKTSANNAKPTKCSSPASFSMMPGSLSRFLQ